MRENQEWIDVYTNLSDLFISVLHEKSNFKSKNDVSSLHDIQLLSGVETLFNYATKLSPSGCMCILRQFDGMHIFPSVLEFFLTYFDFFTKSVI